MYAINKSLHLWSNSNMKMLGFFHFHMCSVNVEYMKGIIKKVLAYRNSPRCCCANEDKYVYIKHPPPTEYVIIIKAYTYS